MPVDELIWEALGSELGRDDHADDPAGRPGDESRREAAVRLLDAALAALAATGHLVTVAELVLRQQRDHLATPAHPDSGDPAPRPAAGHQRIDLTY